MNMLHRKTRVNDGLGVSKVVTSTQDKKEDKEHGKPSQKSEDMELNEDDSQIQKQFAEQLDVSQQVVTIDYERWERFKRPVDGYHMVQKRDILLSWYKRKSFLHYIVTESDILRNPRAKNHG